MNKLTYGVFLFVYCIALAGWQAGCSAQSRSIYTEIRVEKLEQDLRALQAQQETSEDE